MVDAGGWVRGKMKKSCKYCGRVHPIGYECPRKPVRKKRGNREAERIRNSYAWRQKREEIRERDHYLCRHCLERGRFTRDGLEVHHIIPLEERPELALEDNYLITLCGRDHERAERGEIDRGALLRLAGTPPPLEA